MGMTILGTSNPWAITFGILGNFISLLVYLAPMPTFRRIYKKKATEGFDSLPYLVALLSSSLWLYYAFLKIQNAILLVTINSFGIVIELLYIITYIIYAHQDARKLTIILFAAMNVGSFVLVFCVTFFGLHGSHRIQVLGWICMVFSVTVFLAPLSIMAQVIRTKSVQFMPINLSFFLTLNAIMWFGYGYLLKDKNIALPNVMGFALGILQMVLYGIYRNYEKKQIVEGMRNNIVGVNPMGTSEVFPTPVDVDMDVVNSQLQKKEEKMVPVELNHCIV